MKNLCFSFSSSLFFLFFLPKNLVRTYIGEASHTRKSQYPTYWQHVFLAYFSVNTRSLFSEGYILYKIARRRGCNFFEPKRLQSYAVIEHRGNSDKNLSFRDCIHLALLNWNLCCISPDIYRSFKARHFLSSKLLLAISSVAPFMSARQFTFSVYPSSSPYWIANNDFPHVAASPGIQCEKLQWLPALYFERFSARLTRRPPARREISANHTRRFSH